MPTAAIDTKTVLDVDPWLDQNAAAIVARHDKFRKWKDTLEEHEGGYENFTKGYLKFGFNIKDDGTVVYREWAPNAKEAYLIGEFSECSFTSATRYIEC